MNKIDLKDNRVNSFFSSKDPNTVLTEVKGDKFKEYREAWIKTESSVAPEKYPLHLDFELSNKCNLRCKMCILATPTGKEFGKYPQLATDLIKMIIDDGISKGLYSIGTYFNEPLMRQDTVDIMGYAMYNGIVDTWLTTNGTLLTEEKSLDILNSGITRLNISLDARTNKTYHKIRGGDLYNIMRKVTRFLKLKKEGGYSLPLVRVSMVRISLNNHEVQMFKDFWKDKVDYVAIQEYISAAEELDRYHPDDRLLVNQKEFKCSSPFQRLVIRPNGDILPCCNFYSTKLIMGNINEKPIQEIWQDKPITELRQKHIDGEFMDIPVCKKCVSSWMDIQ